VVDIDGWKSFLVKSLSSQNGKSVRNRIMQCYRDGYSDGASGVEPQSGETFYRYFYSVGSLVFLGSISVNSIVEEEKTGLASWPRNY